MKTSEMIEIAMPCAASAMVPSQPSMTVVAENRPISASSAALIGRPRRKTCAKALQSGRQRRRNSWCGR